MATDETLAERMRRWFGRAPSPRVVVHDDRCEIFDRGRKQGEFRWDDVAVVRAYKVPLIGYDDIGLDIYDQPHDVTWQVHDEMDGYLELETKLEQQFALPPGWANSVLQSKNGTVVDLVDRRS